jgi:UDP-glucose 4-epimerase
VNNKEILVTGGSGFLGSHAADSLTDSGFKVFILDRNQSPWLKESQEMIVGDILDDKLINEAVKNKYAVFHFAGIADIQESNEDPLNTVEYNILGTTKLLNACAKEKVSRFIFASSIYVYSNVGGFYRATKQACELLIENYQKLQGLDYTILRFGSLYGRRANKFNWIHNVIYQALTEGKMDRMGDGEELRDYIHVSDAANSCVDILTNQFKNNYVILTGAQTIKINDLLKMISEMMDNKIEINYLKERIEQHYVITPYSFRPRVAKKMISRTHVDLGQGILDTIYDVYKEIKNNEDNIAISIQEGIEFED